MEPTSVSYQDWVSPHLSPERSLDLDPGYHAASHHRITSQSDPEGTDFSIVFDHGFPTGVEVECSNCTLRVTGSVSHSPFPRNSDFTVWRETGTEPEPGFECHIAVDKHADTAGIQVECTGRSIHLYVPWQRKTKPLGDRIEPSVYLRTGGFR